jgi:hypothetical protein
MLRFIITGAFMLPTWTKSLTRSFSGLAAGFGVYAAAQTTSLGQSAAGGPAATNDVPELPPPGLALLEPGTGPAHTVDSRRGLLSGFDDYFAHNYSLHTAHKGLWISPPSRTDVDLVQLPPGGFLQTTRQYVEVRPLRWDWLGQASGLGYNLQCDLGPGIDTANGVWTFKGGLGAYYFSDPNPRLGGDVRGTAFVETEHDLRLGKAPARLVLGTSFSAASGPDLGHGKDARLYSELDFPHLFGGKIATGDAALDEYSPGRFSGVLRANCGASDYGGQFGLYYNHLEKDGKDVSFSAGPEIGYDKRRGATIGFRFRVSPKFW